MFLYLFNETKIMWHNQIYQLNTMALYYLYLLFIAYLLNLLYLNLKINIPFTFNIQFILI